MVSNLGPPRVVSSCAGKGDDPVYEITGPAHFRVVGGGTCSTTLTWSLPSGVQSWTGEASLDPHDATGSRIVMEADRKPVSFLADRRPSSILNLYGPETIVVPLAGAHTFSIVVPATQGDRFAGPETVVIAAGSIHDTPIGTLHAPAPSEPETLVYSRACPGAFPATVEPSEIPIACADYNMRISNIDWSSWSPTGATGTGMLDVNDCDPSCAAGTFHSTPTALTLSAPQRTATQGLVFSTLTYVTQDGTLATWSLAPTASCSSYYENC
jgi:hypothetical protein